MNKTLFKTELKNLGIDLRAAQLKQFEDYYRLLLEWNQKMNLTAITQEAEVYEKHFYDSLLAVKVYAFKDQNICDVGAGAGFPSIPLKIVFPHLQVTIVDSSHKRITFLNKLIDKLALNNVKAVASRAEEYALEHRETYDLVLARAVARLNILMELCLPMVKVEGSFIALKGAQGTTELAEAAAGAVELGARLVKSDKEHLFRANEIRYLFKYDKVKPTKHKYPRAYAKIKKNPL